MKGSKERGLWSFKVPSLILERGFRGELFFKSLSFQERDLGRVF
jgi:hypothetical protein